MAIFLGFPAIIYFELPVFPRWTEGPVLQLARFQAPDIFVAV